jgi:hypothetical protein
MRRFLVLTCVAALLGLLMTVAPAIVHPDANRAEAAVRCDPVGSQTVARWSAWAASVVLCLEVLGNGVRPGALVYCETASTSVPCNWDFYPLDLRNQNNTLIHSERAHATNKTNGAYIATPHWANTIYCNTGYSESPSMRVRFPDGKLSSWHTVEWQNNVGSPC